jgi:uncharacterized membrane protein (GlpM family)
VALLIFLSVGAFVGAIPMLVSPSATQWGLMPVSILKNSPFTSFFIPGLILLVSNGLMPLVALRLIFARKPSAGAWTALQGCVLFGFLSVECWMLRVVAIWHLLYAAVAVAIFVCGLLLWRERTA